MRSNVRLDAQAIETDLETGRIEHSFQYLRDYRPGGWEFAHTVEGLQNLEDALNAGRGVILWMGHFVLHGLAVKKALCSAGYQVHHLSRPEHGYSKTRFGIALLNPLRSTIEDRYLASRIVIQNGREDAALLRAFTLLRGGGIVSITCGAWEGRRVAWVPFLGGFYPLAAGAPSLAHATGAALLPVFCVRDGGARGRLRIVVDRAIDVPRDLSRDNAVSLTLSACMRRHEPFVTEYAGQWRGWNYLAAAKPRSSQSTAVKSQRPARPDPVASAR